MRAFLTAGRKHLVNVLIAILFLLSVPFLNRLVGLVSIETLDKVNTETNLVFMHLNSSYVFSFASHVQVWNIPVGASVWHWIL